MNVVGYVRVSTDRQAEEGFGAEIQEEVITAWAGNHGHHVVGWHRDLGVSGSNGLEARVGLLHAIDAVRERDADGLVVYRLDRLARDLVLQEGLLAEVWRSGARVFSTSPSEDAYLDPTGADADPSRHLIRQVLGAVAQYERAMIRLRLVSGKTRKAAAGGYVGGRPRFGTRALDKSLETHDDEQEAIEVMVTMRRAGASYRAIAAALSAAGHQPRRSAVWHPAVVRSICTRAGLD